MASTAGLEELVAALAGGSGLEQAAYADGLNRLTDAKSKQALMDKRVAEAYMATGKSDAFKTLVENGTDPLVLTELANQQLYLLQGQGVETQNTARDEAAAIAGRIVDPTDQFNAQIGVAGNKMLGPTNVRVQDQAGAAVDKTQREIQNVIAQIGANNALTGQRNALGGKYRAETGAIGEDSLLPAQGLTELAAGSLWNRNPQIPNPDYDPEGWYGIGKDMRQTIPEFGLDEDGIPIAEPLLPEFQVWYSERALTDPNIRKNMNYAIGQFLKEREAKQALEGTLAPPTPPVAPQRDALYGTSPNAALYEQWKQEQGRQ